MTKKREYTMVLDKDEDSDYGVTIPELPGCFSGKTPDEAVANAKEAIELYLETLDQK